MEMMQILVLAAVQGLTEFLPISSSAHLILAPYLLGFPDQGLAFDVAVHLGSLLAVVGYLRRPIARMLRGIWDSLHGMPANEDSRLAWMIIFATFPVGVAGLLGKSLVETELRSTLVIATTTIGFGCLLWLADRIGRRTRDEYSITWQDAVVIGLFQALAIVPGTSRSGITITAALFLGLTRQSASRFSFLLAIPTIGLSGGLTAVDLWRSTNPVDWNTLGLGVLLSFLAAYVCIHLFLRFIERISMLPFVLYRLALGAALLILGVGL